MNLASGNIIAWFHADLQTNPLDVIKIINKNRDILLNQKVLLSGKELIDQLLTVCYKFNGKTYKCCF